MMSIYRRDPDPESIHKSENGFKIKINWRNSRASVSFSECISIHILLQIYVKARIPDETHLVESAQWHHQACHEQICNG